MEPRKLADYGVADPERENLLLLLPQAILLFSVVHGPKNTTDYARVNTVNTSKMYT